MRWIGCSLLLVFAPIALVLTTSCGPTTPAPADDTLVGNFSVTGTLTSNACAPGFNPTTPTTFGARLNVGDGLGTWTTSNGAVTGTASGNTFRVVARSSFTVFTGCVLDQTETIEGSYVATPIDGGSPDAGRVQTATMTGTDSIAISTRSGAACLNVLIENGGNFPMLPCTAVFSLTGHSP